ncbi:MAG: class I tRNA ligase family protein, partial [Patescibacteria group bacterium]
PSAEGLDVCNMYAFTGVDVHGRFMRMKGYDVFEPIGLDGFGIHSENYAIKVGRTPKEHAAVSQTNFYRQLHAIGNSFDWKHSLETYDPDYYRWTQWIFVQMFKHGLAYRAKASVNWCPSCKTVLADEQVIDGKCERTGDAVEKKDLEQWFFRITEYAERLLQNTYKSSFNWTEKVKIGQRNWIGKKEGVNIKYQIQNLSEYIEVFTTRPDTNFGATFIVVAPEHPIIEKITTPEYKDSVRQYIKQTQKKSNEDRITEGRKKTGVFSGAYAINQLNDNRMPVWVSDFVLMNVGTGAVVGVPGHDIRDFEFAESFGLPIKRVVVGADGDTSEITKTEQVQEETGTMINSEFLNGLEIHQATNKMMDYLEEKGWGKRIVTYHLRDWLISRQRYWGAPIPMIYCEKCASEGKSWFDTEESINVSFPPSMALEGKLQRESIQKDPRVKPEDDNLWASGWYPVSESELPVLLPDVKDWQPTGAARGPLSGHPEFYKTKCPHCNSPAERETDVCDTFLDSSWYYLRYPFTDKEDSSRKDNNLPWDKEVLKRWLPIDSYIGGAEHTVLHLLYTRFVYMALRDWGVLDVAESKDGSFDPDEPFKRFYAHGLIIKDGAKMSKSKGNVVIPDEYIKLFGSDTLRTYLMFLGPFEAGGDFRDTGISGMYKWLSRVWRLVHDSANNSNKKSYLDSQAGKKILAKTIKGVSRDMEQLRYNTAIAKLMEYTNWWMDQKDQVSNSSVESFLKLLAPFAPHMSEELYQELTTHNPPTFAKAPAGKQLTTHNAQLKTHNWSIHTQHWPAFDPELVKEEEVTIIIQINGRMRDSIVMTIQNGNEQNYVEQTARSSAKVKKWLDNDKIRKIVFIPGKLINFVI